MTLWQSALSGVNLWDWLFALAFLAMAGMYFLGRLQGNYPNVVLSGDGGNIASYAAALDHPDWFKTDPVLGSTYNLSIYSTIHIPIIRFLDRLTGDYGLSSVLLIFPETFLQLLGFYILGRVLFKNRFWALILSLITAVTIYNVIGMGEIWGIWTDSLPRVTFQSLLPFLLALVVVWKDRPARWPWLMVISGLLVYVHPVSAPTWGFAIWLSLWLLLPKNWNWRRRILVMLGLGLLFLAAITPFAITYLSHQAGNQTVDYQTVLSILQTYSPLNILGAGLFFVRNLTIDLLIPVAVVGFAVTWIYKRSDRLLVRLVLLWMAGLFIACLLLPFVEQVITQKLHILPFETELVRGIRYFVPLFLLFWLWPLAEWSSRLTTSQGRLAIFAIGILLVSYWEATNPTAYGYDQKAYYCLKKYHLVCSFPRPIDGLIDALRKQTSPGDGIFFFSQNGSGSQSLSIRYEALRPLVYSELDNGLLNYGNRSSLVEWSDITQIVSSLRSTNNIIVRLEGLIPLAKSLQAKYVVVDFDLTTEDLAGQPAILIWQNESYSILKLK